VLLTVNNDLLESVDELLLSLLRERLLKGFVHEVLGLVLLSLGLLSSVVVGGELVLEGGELALGLLSGLLENASKIRCSVSKGAKDARQGRGKMKYEQGHRWPGRSAWLAL
jgi:hypothetical protein